MARFQDPNLESVGVETTMMHEGLQLQRKAVSVMPRDRLRLGRFIPV